MDAKVTVSFPIFIEHTSNGGHGFFSFDCPLSGMEYGSDNQIKTKLRARAEMQVAEALRAVGNQRSRIIGCTDGTILLVRFRHDAWGYEIAGPGRNYAGACIGGKDFEDVLEAARRHAEGSYGGVAWENSR